jgi:hypothetical protein
MKPSKERRYQHVLLMLFSQQYVTAVLADPNTSQELVVWSCGIGR